MFISAIGNNAQMTVDSKVLGGIIVCNNVVIGAENIDVPNFSCVGGGQTRMLSVKNRLAIA